MSKESVIICVDTSEHMRNGDFQPTRILAQLDAVDFLTRAKLRQNAENTVGLISLSNETKILTTFTNQSMFNFVKLQQLQAGGDINLLTGLKRAYLTLKHRLDRGSRLRIIAFVGSPLQCSNEEVTILAKKLRREKVNVDIVNFGETALNSGILTHFIDILNTNDTSPNSHLLTIPTGPEISGLLRSSQIVGGGEVAANVNSFMDEEDPELAEALRLSTMEFSAQQGSTNNVAGEFAGPITESDEDLDLRRAIEMSMQTQEPVASETIEEAADFSNMTDEEQMEYAMLMSMGTMETQEPVASETTEETVDFSNMTDEEQMEYAMRMSMGAMNTGESMEVETDSDVLRSVLEGMSGVDSMSGNIEDVINRFSSNKKDDQE